MDERSPLVQEQDQTGHDRPFLNSSVSSSLLSSVSRSTSRSSDISYPSSNNKESEVDGTVLQTHLPSVYAVVATIFLQSIGFSIVLPSLWLYLKFLKHGVTYTFLGWVTSIYSVGQCVGSPLFGWCSNKRSNLEVLLLTLVISVAGNIAYSLGPLLEAVPALYLVLVSRFVVGVGAGNVATCRAYASHATDLSNRTKIMAYTSAAQGLGFVIGPALAAALSQVNFRVGAVVVNQYTAAGYVSALMSAVNIFVLLAVKFRECSHARHGEGEKRDLPRDEFYTILVVIFLFFTIIFVFSMFETIATPMFDKYYGWDVFKTGVFFLCVSALSVVSFLAVSRPQVNKAVDERLLLLIGGYFLCCVALLVMATWPFLESYPPLWQISIGGVLISISYPIGSLLIYSIYSKVLHPKEQGTKMGWLTAGGSVARIIGPIWASNAFRLGGGTLLFISTAEVVFFSCFIIVLFWRRLVPHPEQHRLVPAS